jgi:TM2 domain-containing membrane protein YozV
VDAVTAAGWYPDPSGPPGQRRYWDGGQWSSHIDPAPPGPFGPATGYGQPGQMSPYGGGYPAQPMVAAKNPAVSLLISFFLPGVGSMVNGDVGTGVTILIAYVIAAVLIVVFIGILLAPAVWIWGLVDAYQGAQRWNRRHGIIS